MAEKETLWWCENVYGEVYLTSPISPIRQGFQRYSTTTPSEMDRIFRKLDAQTKREHEGLTEALFNRRKERMAQWRSDLNAMLAQSSSPMERAFIRAALRANERREEKLNRNSVYGVSAMQTASAPVPTENKSMSVEEIRTEKAVN